MAEEIKVVKLHPMGANGSEDTSTILWPEIKPQTAADIDSGNSELGSVLTSNGQGGASWLPVGQAETPVIDVQVDGVSIVGNDKIASFITDELIPNGIASIEKTESVGLVDVYRINYTDSTLQPFIYTVTNGTIGANGIDGKDGKDGKDGIDGTNGTDGRGIDSIIKINTNNLVDTYQINYTDSTTSTFDIVNGADGLNGTNGNDGRDGTDGVDGRGIVSITKTSTDDLVDTYQIAYTDSTVSTFTVTNGKIGQDGIVGKDGNGISGIVKYSTSGLTDTYRISYTDSTYFDFDVTNGTQGIQGIQGPPGNDGLTTAISVNSQTYTHNNGTITLPNYPTVPGSLSASQGGTDLSVVTTGEKYTWNSKQDALTPGSNIQINSGTISATDTTYSSLSAANGGSDVSLVTTGEKYNWNQKIGQPLTTAPSGAKAAGEPIEMVVLDTPPAAYYSGYLYIITEENA